MLSFCALPGGQALSVHCSHSQLTVLHLGFSAPGWDRSPLSGQSSRAGAVRRACALLVGRAERPAVQGREPDLRRGTAQGHVCEGRRQNSLLMLLESW